MLFVELLDAGFAQAFWEFIAAGGYEVRSRADGGQLYRFSRPRAHDYPYMIELFSRAPEGFDLAPGSTLTPLPIEKSVTSLSAILLDEGYYGFLRDHTLELDGLPLLGEAGLIPFKAKAYLDLSGRKSAGEAVDSKDVRKHRSDVFRLLQLLPAWSAKPLPDPIRADMAAFLEAVRADETFKPSDLGLKMSAQGALNRLAEAYDL